MIAWSDWDFLISDWVIASRRGDNLNTKEEQKYHGILNTL